MPKDELFQHRRVSRRVHLPLWLLGAIASALLGACSDPAAKAMQQGALAQQQLEAGQVAAARITIQDGIEQRDDIPLLHLLRGRIEYAAGSPNNAFAAYSTALSLDAANVEAMQGVAQFGLQTGNLAEAEDAAQRILALNPSDTNALTVLGLIQVVRRQTTKAIASADKILATRPDDEAASILKARALFVDGRGSEALTALNSLVAKKGMTQGISMTLLEIYRELSDSANMMVNFDYLRKERPQDLTLRIDEANTLYKTGNAARARAVLWAGMLATPPDIKQSNAIAWMFHEYDRTPFTDQQIAQFGQKAPTYALQEIARFYLDSNQPDRLNALLGANASTDAQALRARAAANTGRDDEALRLAEPLLRDDVTQCDALLARSSVYLRRNRVDDAVIDAQTAQSQCPQLVAGWSLLARAYHAKNNDAGTRRVFEQGTRLNQQSTQLASEFSAWLLMQRQPQRAIASARRLVRAAPAQLSGWQLYLAVCQKAADAACTAEAQAGLAKARTMLGIDLLPGERPPNGLFGRLRRI